MGASALHYAAQSGNIQVAKLLIDQGAFINLQSPTHGVTPLMTAVWHRNIDLVEFFLNQENINTEIRSTFGLKAEELIGFGNRENDRKAHQESQKLNHLFRDYYERRRSNSEVSLIFKILTDQDLSDEEKAGQIRSLINQGADVNTIYPVMSSGNDGHTPLLIAARDGLTQIVRILLEAGADQTISDHYMQAVPLHKAAYMGHTNVIRILEKYPGFDEVLNLQGPFNGYTPLHDAVWHGHFEATEILIQAGARTDLAGLDGNTPLDLAEKYDYKTIVRFLNN
jgi:ankyrin repeat protein